MGRREFNASGQGILKKALQNSRAVAISEGIDLLVWICLLEEVLEDREGT
jgi:hypothetical protein